MQNVNKKYFIFSILVAVVAVALIGIILYRSPVTPFFDIATEAEISDAEKAIVLTPPGAEDTAAYTETVLRLAQESDTLTIGANCAMEPLVLRLREGAVLNIVNNDTSEHTIAFEDQNFFNVSAGGRRAINITEMFQRGEGVYRYRCNDISLDQNVGVMSIVE